MEYLVEYLKVVLIGVVEGITEWLPISSTGHMILVNEFVQLQVTPDFWNMFLVVIQLGAILAVCLLYFRALNPFALSKTRQEKKDTWSLWGKIVVGVIPAAVVGLPLNDWMEEHFQNAWVVSGALIVYGIAFILIELWRASKGLSEEDGASRPRGAHFADAGAGAATAGASAEAAGASNAAGTQQVCSMKDLSYGRALAIGCFQVLSLVPGTSRSGSTILGALLLGTSRKIAAEFSFYMAIPVMFGASLLKLLKFFIKGNHFDMAGYLTLGLGMVVALLVSIATIKLFMSYIRTKDFKIPGAPYSQPAAFQDL